MKTYIKNGYQRGYKMRYYNVKIQHRKFPEDGVLEVKMLANSVFDVNKAVCEQIQLSGNVTDDYVITIEELIGEKDFNKSSNSTQG